MRRLKSEGMKGMGVAAGLVFLLAGSPAQAEYREPSAGFAAGGGSAGSGSYALTSVIGQPGITGSSAGTRYQARHGFLPALGGWRILYPVISATPGVLSFTLRAGAQDSRQAALHNAGGGVLAWSVAKGDQGESYFSVTPASGSGDATLTFSADATGLPAGSYSDSFTISGAGIAETVQVNLTLTVLPGTYHLAVTLASDTQGKGGGSLHSAPSGISCSNTGSDPAGATGICEGDFDPGTVVTLYQSPDSDSTWASWSVPGCGTGQSCEVLMDGDRQVGASFPYAYLCKLNSSGARSDSLAASLSDAAASDTILARDVTFQESLVLQGKSILLRGGLSPWYLPQNARTVLKGRISIRSGSLRARDLAVR